ncbi:MAG: carboxypeptidase-like regulatory domain-containing protein [Coriobacteriia bacterium]|nr:carboxypeptidase-like regulatory domain-containing protein [Coriobacteriia bacterium]
MSTIPSPYLTAVRARFVAVLVVAIALFAILMPGTAYAVDSAVVAGSLSDGAGSPLVGLDVELYRADGTGSLVAAAVSGAGGAYSIDIPITEILPQAYYLRIVDPAVVPEHPTVCWKSAGAAFQSQGYEPFVVGPGAAVILGIEVPRFARIVGKAWETTDIKSLDQISVTLLKQQDGVWEPAATATTTASAFGLYRFDLELPVGASADYKVLFSDRAHVWSNFFYDSATRTSAAGIVSASEGVTVTAGQLMARTSSIVGVVKDAAGRPVAGAEVAARFVDEGLSDAALDPLPPVFTDASGAYSISGVSLGAWSVSVSDADRMRYLAWETAASIDVTSSDVAVRADATLRPAGRIRGVVKEAGTNMPLGGMVVLAQQYDPQTARTIVTSVETYTTGDGLFEVGGLAAGPVELSAFDVNGQHLTTFYGNVQDRDDAVWVQQHEGRTWTVAPILMPLSGTLSGQLTDAGGSPLPADPEGLPIGTVDAFSADASGAWVWRGTWPVSGDGLSEYVIGDLPAGSYVLRFAVEGWAPTYSGGASSPDAASRVTMTTGDVRLPDRALMRGGSIAGVLSYEGGGRVQGGDGAVVVRAVDASFTKDAALSQEGTYSVAGLPPGTYKVLFRPLGGNANDDAAAFAPRYHGGSTSFAGAEDVTVVDGVVADVGSDEVTSGLRMSGIVSDGGGARVRGAQVILERVGDTTETRWSATTGFDGSYEVENLVPGDYAVSFVPGAAFPELAEVYHGGTPFRSLCETYPVAADQTLDVTLPVRATLSGRVMAPDGAPGVFSADRLRLTLLYKSAGLWREVGTGYAASDGVFAYDGSSGPGGMTHLVPGSYAVRVDDERGVFASRVFGIEDTGVVSPAEPTTTIELTGAAREITGLSPRLVLEAAQGRPSIVVMPPSVAYGGASTLYCSLRDRFGWGMPRNEVVLEWSPNGSSLWTPLTTTMTAGTTDAEFVQEVRPSARTYYRLGWRQAGLATTYGPVVSVSPLVYLSLYAPTSARHARTFSVSGYLKPAHNGATVYVYAYRYVRGRWVIGRSYSTRAARYRSYSRYVRSVSLPYAGRWMIVTRYRGDASHAANSATRYVTVR